jgi:autotransporter-associated beta strand protein
MIIRTRTADLIFLVQSRVVSTFLLLVNAVSLTVHGQIPAFPGAEGFGALASGGRYGDVYHVMNLSSSASTPGSFAYGLANAPATGRTIVFDVSGYFPVSGNLNVAQPNLTIAGQTAPGDGVGLAGGTFWIEKTNVIVRHFRFRNGLSADCLDMSVLTTNVIIDHCDALFGMDENFSSFNSPPENMTFQWSFNAWGLYPHSAGGLWYVNHATAHHTLWAHNHTRDPKALPSGLLDWVNNVTFDYGIGFILADSTTTADHRANVENCYFIAPPGNPRPYALSRSGVDSNGVPNFSLFLTNCLWDTDGDYLLDGYDHGTGILSVTPGSLRLMTNAFARTAGIPVTQDSALVAYKTIVSQCGPLRLDANGANGLRDEVANELIRSLLLQRHDDFSNVVQTAASNGGYGTLLSTPAPADTDRDGMPDFWELALGSNPNLDDHTNQVPAGAFLANNPAGYTLLEEYLHFKASPHAVLGESLADNPTSQDVDLRFYTSGFTNKVPVTCTLANVSTGTVALVGGNIAHFVPPTNFLGRASFNFTVTDGDGSSWSQQFLLLVASNPPPRSLIWKGDGSTNLWSTNAANWIVAAGTLTAFRQGDCVSFDDTGANTPALTVSGDLTVGSMTVNAVRNYTLVGSGSLAGPAALTKNGPGTLTVGCGNAMSGVVTLNQGTLLVNNSTGMGLGTNTIIVNSGGTLGGTGRVGGAVTVNAGGALAPGGVGTVGTFTISNRLSLNPSAILRFDVGSSCDRLAVSNNLVLGGTLNVTNVAGFGAGTCTLMTCGGALSGTLPTIGSKPSGYTCTVNTNTAGQVRLVVTAQTPPAFTQYQLVNGNLVLSGTGPTNETYHLLSSTNVALPLSNWTRLATNQFDAGDHFVFTNSISNAPLIFWRLQL